MRQINILQYLYWNHSNSICVALFIKKHEMYKGNSCTGADTRVRPQQNVHMKTVNYINKQHINEMKHNEFTKDQMGDFSL